MLDSPRHLLPSFNEGIQQESSLVNLPESASGRPILDIVLAVAREAGAIARDRFYTTKEVSLKRDASLVTDVDVQSERYVRDALAVEFPKVGFLGEELGLSGSPDGIRWIVDPLDGTRNYVAGLPHFAVSLALADGPDVLLGVTYDPMRDEMFHAVKGQGAYLNSEPILVTRRTSVAECLLGLDIGGINRRSLSALKLVESLWPNMQSVRVMGSATLGLAYAASGRLDIFFHQAMAPWDVATGMLLVRESGGALVDRLGGGPATLQSTGAVASSPSLLEEFLRLTRGQEWYSVE